MMKKKFSAVLVTGLFFLIMVGLAQAALTTIGTATYGGSDYNLIYDDDDTGHGGGGLVWLDYSNPPANWTDQKDWAAGLDLGLTYNIDSAYIVTWNDTAWRLPDTIDGTYDYSCDGATTGGYNITTSEMGHLYYTELENLGYYGTSGNF